MCLGCWAGVTYLRYTELTSLNKDETAVHCCDPALSVVVMLVSRNRGAFHVVSALQSIVFNKLLPLARRRRHRSELKSHLLSLYEAAERSLNCSSLIGCLLHAKKEQKEIKCDHAPRACERLFGCLPRNPLQQFCSQTPRSVGKRYPSPLIIIGPLLSFVDFVNFSTN